MKDINLYQPNRQVNHVSVDRKTLEKLIESKRGLDVIRRSAMRAVLALWLMVLGFALGQSILWIVR